MRHKSRTIKRMESSAHSGGGWGQVWERMLGIRIQFHSVEKVVRRNHRWRNPPALSVKSMVLLVPSVMLAIDTM